MPSSKQAIIAYVPVLHAGYKNLFDKYPDADIYVFSTALIARFDNLRKELRAMTPCDTVAAINGWGRNAKLLDEKSLGELKTSSIQLIMPDEDVTHELAQSDFGDHEITFDVTFLRWDRRKIEGKADPVDPDRTISQDKLDVELMQRAAKLGQKSTNLYRRLGALLVRDGEVLISGYNGSYPTQHTSWIDGDPRNNANRGTSIDITTDIHAEARAISEAARQGIELQNSSMYVLDFPCPTCAKLIANSGVAKLYYAQGYSVLDGQQTLHASGIELIHVTGLTEDDTHPDTWVPYPEKQKS